MSTRQEENDIYIIPPNFIETGTIFGGTIKLRNAAEALFLSLLIGFPVFHLPATLTTKIIICCLTVLPLSLFAIIGIDGESLSSFAVNFFIYRRNRRIVGLQTDTEEADTPKAPGKQKKKKTSEKKVKPRKEDFAEEFGQRKERRQAKQTEGASSHKDRRADINRHLETIREEMKTETDERCLALQKDYEMLIRRIGSREAITRRFFIVFEYEPFSTNRGGNEENDAISALTTAVRTAKTYLQQCGNELMIPDNEDEMATEVLYNLLNRKTSVAKPLSVRVNEVIGQYINAGRRDDIGHIPAMEFLAPESIDYTHSNYVVMDGIYHTYLLIPSRGYRSQVCAGWISLLVNAGGRD